MGGFHRGQIKEARDSAFELMQVGRDLDDRRATGFGLTGLSWIALVSDSYAEALQYSEQALGVAVTAFDRITAATAKGAALVLLRRSDEGLKILKENRLCAFALGYIIILASIDALIGVGEAFQGNIAHGIKSLETAGRQREKDGYLAAAHWYRMFSERNLFTDHRWQ